MREVIYLDKKENEKPVEFTHVIRSGGWFDTSIRPDEYKHIIYLGNCAVDGDMFAVKTKHNTIVIFKGHLNSGKY